MKILLICAAMCLAACIYPTEINETTKEIGLRDYKPCRVDLVDFPDPWGESGQWYQAILFPDKGLPPRFSVYPQSILYYQMKRLPTREVVMGDGDIVWVAAAGCHSYVVTTFHPTCNAFASRKINTCN